MRQAPQKCTASLLRLIIAHRVPMDLVVSSDLKEKGSNIIGKPSGRAGGFPRRSHVPLNPAIDWNGVCSAD
jgi:hypothetical protein